MCFPVLKSGFENSELKLFLMGYWEPYVKGAVTSILFIFFFLIQYDSHCGIKRYAELLHLFVYAWETVEIRFF